MLFLGLLAQDCISQAKVFPASCGVCNATKKMAWGGPENLKRVLISYRVPDVPERLSRSIPSEPWVFEVTLSIDGRLCALRQVDGPSDDYGRLLAAAVARQWIFEPFQSLLGATCYQTRLHFYVRQRKGKAVIEVPGVTISPVAESR